MKIALVNVKYSPNVGDGLIAECLEAGLSASIPGAEFVSIDLAGRTNYPMDAGSGRGLALSVLSKLPPALRRGIVASRLRMLAATRYGRIWEAALEGCDALVLGGGQLMADADLNFPVKINAVAARAAAHQPVCAVYGVGVSAHWSRAGARMFREAMGYLSPAHIAVRDETSRANWAAHFSGSPWPDAALCRDPGLIAGMVYPVADRPPRPRALIGIGVVHPLTLNLHTDGAPLSMTRAIAVWTQLIAALVSRGHDVALFTNGPSDDEAFLTTLLHAAMPEREGRLMRLARPKRPQDLVENIAGCNAIIAHRLHAGIVAYACGVPLVGLGWDTKLPSFFRSVGRGAYVVGDMQDVPPQDICDLIDAAMKDPVPEVKRRQVANETWTSIHACAKAITDGVSGRA